jgi:hypothetical protein
VYKSGEYQLLELPNVSGKRALPQSLKERSLRFKGRAAESFGVEREEVAKDRLDIFRPLPEGRDSHLMGGYAVEKVLPKFTLGHLASEIPIGCEDQSCF